jgi:hypothetical protein
MKHVLALALLICAGSLFATAASAEPPGHAGNDDASLHPGHQGHLSSGREYPGRPATEFHESLEAEGEPSFPTGPGGWAEQQSDSANAQRSSTDATADNRDR